MGRPRLVSRGRHWVKTKAVLLTLSDVSPVYLLSPASLSVLPPIALQSMLARRALSRGAYLNFYSRSARLSPPLSLRGIRATTDSCFSTTSSLQANPKFNDTMASKQEQ